MKAVVFLLAGLGLLACSADSSAQDDAKLRNDPTYSTQNYKHPNKAATAQRWQGTTGVEVRPPYQPANRQASYKNQSPNQVPSGGVTVDYRSSEQYANRNYKAQQPRAARPANTEVARKDGSTRGVAVKAGNATGE